MGHQSYGRLDTPGYLPEFMRQYRPRACKAQQASSVMRCEIAIQAPKSRLDRPSQTNFTGVVRCAHKTFIFVSNKVCFNLINNRKMTSSTMNQMLQYNPLLPNTIGQNRLSLKAKAQRCSLQEHQRRQPCYQTCAAGCKNSCISKTSKVQELC